MSFDIDQEEAEECYLERERVSAALAEMIHLAQTYSEWASKWGEHRDQMIAERAMCDLLEEWAKRHQKVAHDQETPCPSPPAPAVTGSTSSPIPTPP